MATCNICCGHIHFTCTGIAEKARSTFFDVIKKMGWVCCDCQSSTRSIVNKLQASVNDLQAHVIQLRCDLDACMSKVTARYTDTESKAKLFSEIIADEADEAAGQAAVHKFMPTLNNNVQSIVCKELQDASKRKCNVIVTGLAETGTKSDDTTAFQELCSNYLGSKPSVAGCLRLGSKSSDRPRRLLVRLHREETATDLLKSVSCLRRVQNSSISSIYINPDLTPAAAKAAFEERQRRRTRKAEISSRTPRITGNVSSDQLQYCSTTNTSDCQLTTSDVQFVAAGNTDQCQFQNDLLNTAHNSHPCDSQVPTSGDLHAEAAANSPASYGATNCDHSGAAVSHDCLHQPLNPDAPSFQASA